MRGELFVLAVVCVFFVQVQGDRELDVKIQEAITYVRPILYKRYNELSNFESNMLGMFRLIYGKNRENLAEAAFQEADMKNFLREMASFIKKEAQTSDSSVLSCIDKVCNTFTQKVGNVTMKLKIGLKAEQILLDRESDIIKHDADRVQRLSYYEYERSERRIRNCTKVDEVNDIVRNYEHLIYVMGRFLYKTDKEVQTVVESYDDKVKQYRREFKKEMENFKTQSVAEMTKCVYPKVAISGRTAFLQLIKAH